MQFNIQYFRQFQSYFTVAATFFQELNVSSNRQILKLFSLQSLKKELNTINPNTYKTVIKMSRAIQTTLEVLFTDFSPGLFHIRIYAHCI